MESNNSTDTSLKDKDKKIVERSASYPSITIEEAIEFTQSVSKNFTPSHVITRDDIAAVLKTKAASIQRDVAASVQYGLFNRHKDGYQISTLLKELNFPINETEKRKTIIELFKSPKLYKELLEKYDGHAVPSDLKPILIRFHGIAEKAASDCADIFLKNANYCGVLRDSNILCVNQTLSRLTSGNLQFAEVIEDLKLTDTITAIETKQETTKLLPPKSDSEEQVKIPLSDKKFAYLTYPIALNEKDISILKKQIELLELTIT